LLQNAPIVREWVGLRPTRNTLRIEHEVVKFPSGNLQVTFCESAEQYCMQILAVVSNDTWLKWWWNVQLVFRRNDYCRAL